MKTIEEAANEYAESFRFKADNGGWFAAKVSDFSAGAAFAESWIDFYDEMPEYLGDDFYILVKDLKGRMALILIDTNHNIDYMRLSYTHWRPINKL